MSDLETRIDALYGLAPAEFTGAKAQLAKELVAAGDAGAAKQVKDLRKPVVSAWALNVLSREDPGALEELEAVGRRLRAAQGTALEGGDVESLRAATQERHTIVKRMTGAAIAILERAGPSGASHADDISSTVDAAAVDPEAFDELRKGRLTRPLRPPTGFGEGAALKAVPSPKSRAPEPPQKMRDPRERAREIAALRRELARAEGQGRKAAAEVARAREQLEDADRRRAGARDRLREAEANARGASLELKRLTRDLSKIEPDAR